jgi:hypothetical protein
MRLHAVHLLGAGVLIALASFASGAGPRDQTGRPESRGACYCRVKDELLCTANLTARECDLRCSEALCDDWFWKERLPCWNWGYGG